MSRVRRTPLADRDLEGIWLFIAQDNQSAADRLLDTLNDKIYLLADNPRMGPARPDIAEDLRYLPVGSYLLLYRLIEGGIELVRAVHGARDLLQFP
jgi:toxin ParE1/3/4